MQDNTNKTTQELFDKLMLGFSKHFEKSSRRLDDDFEYESKDKIPNIDYTDGGASFIEFVRKQQEKYEKIK